MDNSGMLSYCHKTDNLFEENCASMQKNEFITRRILEIFIKHHKFFILGTQGRPDQAHQKIVVSTCRKL